MSETSWARWPGQFDSPPLELAGTLGLMIEAEESDVDCWVDPEEGRISLRVCWRSDRLSEVAQVLGREAAYGLLAAGAHAELVMLASAPGGGSYVFLREPGASLRPVIERALQKLSEPAAFEATLRQVESSPVDLPEWWPKKEGTKLKWKRKLPKLLAQWEANGHNIREAAEACGLDPETASHMLQWHQRSPEAHNRTG